MGVNTNTNETYDVSTIREDLQDAMISISPTETPFMTAIGRKKATSRAKLPPQMTFQTTQLAWQTTHKLVIK